MDQIQKGYYNYQFVPDVLQVRLAAIKNVVPPASRLVDLGCNDGTISKLLLQSGHASASIGVDFQDLRVEPPTTFQFIGADLREFDLQTLPQTDGILCLNLIHHLCLHGIGFARQFMQTLSEKAGFVILDMGSLTAQIDPRLDQRWLQRLRIAWRSDQECWADLFRPFTARRALLTYPFQLGRRVLWKLTSTLEPAYDFDVLEETSSETVRVRKLRRKETEELFWAKSYLEARDNTQARALRSTIHESLKASPFDCLLPLAQSEEHGEIYAYDQEIAGNEGLTFSESLKTFSPNEFFGVRLFSSQSVPSLGNRPLGSICNFRVQKTSRGLTFFRFEPLII